MMIDRASYRRTLGLCLALGLVLAPAGWGAFAATPPNVWPQILAQANLQLPVAAGVEYHHSSLTTADGPLEVHQLRVDLRVPTVQVGLGLARDRLMSDDEPVSSMVLRSGAIAGINGDYFDIHQTGVPLNIVVKDGRLLRSPWRFVALGIGKDGSARVIRYRWAGAVALADTGESRPLDFYNGGLSPDGVVAISDIRDPGAPEPDAGVRQTVVELTPGEGGRYFVKQVWPQQAFSGPVPGDDLVLVGRGAGADWLLRTMTAGSVVQVSLTTDPDYHEFQVAIGGGPVLVQDGQVVEDPDAPAPREHDRRNPVTAVGIGRDGRTLTFVEVDGRQPSLSIGLTRPQLAQYMQRLGAYQAMAFDSGGSATMVVRLPGQAAPEVVNSPSDGTERPVADALLVYSTAVPGPPARLLVNAGQPLDLYAGARTALSVIATDAQGNPVPLPDPIQATNLRGLVTLGPDGMLTAGSAAGSGSLRVQSGTATGSVPVAVVTQLSRLVLAPGTTNVTPGGGTRFALRGEDAAGRPVILPDGSAAWTVDPPWLGTVSADGEFASQGTLGAGTVTARLGGVAARADLEVSIPVRRAGDLLAARAGDSVARYISEFDQGNWSFRGYPESVTGGAALVSTPGHDGHPSARLEFHLDGTGSRAAYLETNLILPGSPVGIALWVDGDGSGVWLRGVYAQAAGERGTVTLARQVNWRGWRPATAMLPEGLAYPVTWLSIYVVETNPAKTPSGTLYLSSLRAIYSTAVR